MSDLKVNSLQNAAGNQSVSQTTIYSGTAKAWSNLNGTGTIAERDSFNISGYVDNGTGDYTFTIASDMSDANYSFVGSTEENSTADYGSVTQVSAGGQAAGSLRTVCVLGSAATQYDRTAHTVLIHGDLA
jgi:hypothetical protein